MWEKTSWTVGEGGEMPGLSVGSKGARHRGHSEGKGQIWGHHAGFGPGGWWHFHPRRLSKPNQQSQSKLLELCRQPCMEPGGGLEFSPVPSGPNPQGLGQCLT